MTYVDNNWDRFLAMTDIPRCGALVNAPVTMSTGKSMAIGTATTKDIRLQREPSVVWAEGNSTWMGAYHYTTSYDWLSTHYGTFYSYANVSNPLPTAGYSSVGESSEHPANLVGNLAFAETYLFYVD